ncbi:MAG: nucleotidyltransferase domain-containing protein [Candidatus Odinarchaeum yellowstonii]|uniref:Nucleotidyltransferase domain-containing protein n=1 Tax=Odinarchaeota yellowstonii (strain LCB_4) TaxID=1841599 RepID=A0AAF0IBG1_ODILC|nr:MAG: nucleotidyltransferase domain-containing protein [Candidatus Odinarchaeum yellowstonii]
MLYVYESEILNEIEAIINKSKESIQIAVLYGSVTRGEHKPESDIDLIIVADESKIKELEEEFSNLYLKYFIPISVKFYTLNQKVELYGRKRKQIKNRA